MNKKWKFILATVAGTVALWSSLASAKKKEPIGAWAVTQTNDPITGTKSCVVAAYDYVGKFKFSQFARLYPVVEMNSAFGLIVGVSSGGRTRLPTGDIVWRVDDKPFREIKAADNPAPSGAVPVQMPEVADIGSRTINDTVANAMRMTAAMTATSTVASGEKAREMVQEMLEGRSLLYRSATAASAFGLPSPATYGLGQYTPTGWRPIPLDESFRAGLTACGIASGGPSEAQKP